MYPGRGTCIRGWEREGTHIRRELKVQDVLNTGSGMAEEVKAEVKETGLEK